MPSSLRPDVWRSGVSATRAFFSHVSLSCPCWLVWPPSGCIQMVSCFYILFFPGPECSPHSEKTPMKPEINWSCTTGPWHAWLCSLCMWSGDVLRTYLYCNCRHWSSTPWRNLTSAKLVALLFSKVEVCWPQQHVVLVCWKCTYWSSVCNIMINNCQSGPNVDQSFQIIQFGQRLEQSLHTHHDTDVLQFEIFHAFLSRKFLKEREPEEWRDIRSSCSWHNLRRARTLFSIWRPALLGSRCRYERNPCEGYTVFVALHSKDARAVQNGFDLQQSPVYICLG